MDLQKMRKELLDRLEDEFLQYYIPLGDNEKALSGIKTTVYINMSCILRKALGENEIKILYGQQNILKKLYEHYIMHEYDGMNKSRINAKRLLRSYIEVCQKTE